MTTRGNTLARKDEGKRLRFYDDVGLRVRDLRLTAGLSQEALGRRVGVNQSQVGRIEDGLAVCSLYVAASLAEVFDVTLDEIVRVTIDREEAAE